MAEALHQRHSVAAESFFKKVALVLSYDLCEIYKNTFHPITYQLFPITPQNQTTLLCKQISKVT